MSLFEEDRALQQYQIGINIEESQEIDRNTTCGPAHVREVVIVILFHGCTAIVGKGANTPLLAFPCINHVMLTENCGLHTGTS